MRDDETDYRRLTHEQRLVVDRTRLYARRFVVAQARGLAQVRGTLATS